MLGDWEAAAQDALEAVRRDPSNAKACERVARGLLLQNRLQEAPHGNLSRGPPWAEEEPPPVLEAGEDVSIPNLARIGAHGARPQRACDFRLRAAMHNTAHASVEPLAHAKMRAARRSARVRNAEICTCR